MKKYLFALLTITVLFACESEKEVPLVKLDLLEYGVPVSIMAPDSATVEKSDFGPIMKDVTIKKGKDFFVQIYASQATTTDVGKLKAQELAEVKGKKYFSKIILDEPDGFIYETKVDSSYIDYGFRHVRVQGTTEYIFQTGLIGPFSLESVKTMYAAVKPQK